jgi:hypothetical protein
MRVTVTGLYSGPLPASLSLYSRRACPAAIALPPDSEVTLNASFPSTGEACPSVNYTPESITAPDYSANGQPTAVYVSGGCSGHAGNFDLLPLATNNISFYGPQPDGGASWVLAVDFFPGPDAGACNVNSSCTDLYVGNNQKL